MTRTNNKPSSQSQSNQRAALLAERARAMQGSPTFTEDLLWARIRGRRLGVSFRRQVPLLGRFIADFMAPALAPVPERTWPEGWFEAIEGAIDDPTFERAPQPELESRALHEP